MKSSTVLKFLIPLSLACLLVWLILRKINVNHLIDQISSADIKWVSIAIFISLLAHLSRAYRWNILLEPLGYKPSLFKTFAAVMVGYFGNIFLPRGGEVMRCMVLTKIDKVPFNSSFGTVVTERAFDFICLVFLIGASLLLEFQRFKLFFESMVFTKGKGPASADLLKNNVFIGLLVFSIIILLTIFLLRKRIMNSAIYSKVKIFLEGLLQGVLSIKNIRNKTGFILHTFLIWFGYYSMTYLMFFALPATSGLGALAGLVILIVGGLGMSAPVSGGIGPFHIMVAGALQLFYNLDKEDGIAYAFLIHTSQLISIIIIGGLSTLYALVSGKKSKKELAYDNAE